MKFKIILNIILVVIFLSIGIYLLEHSLTFSVISFVTSIAFIILTFMTFADEKKKKITFSEETITKEINIKYYKNNLVINVLRYCIFIILSISFFNFFKEKYTKNDSNSIFLTIVVIILVLFCFIKMILEIKKFSKILISINNDGIQLKNETRISWNQITSEGILTRQFTNRDSKHDGTTEVNYLYFYHNDEKIEINIDDFDITHDQFVQVLKIFRSRFNNSGLI